MDTENTMQVKEFGSSMQFFLYLVLFISLGYVAFGVGNILFEFINKSFPDLISFDYQAIFDQSVVKFSVSSLFVAGPIYFILMKKITKFLTEGKVGLESPARKWLTYFVLFLSAGMIVGDLIALMNNFLNGDTPERFLLKVLIVLVIASGIFVYYLWDVKRKEIGKNDCFINKIAFNLSLFLVASVFIFGFFIIDSPAISRQKNIDQQTVISLQAVDESIQNYFSDAGKLPQKLEDLQSTRFSFGSRSIESITYEVKGPESYSLCAEFVRSSLNDVTLQNGPYMNDWKHGGGEYCFNRIALKKNSFEVPIAK